MTSKMFSQQLSGPCIMTQDSMQFLILKHHQRQSLSAFYSTKNSGAFEMETNGTVISLERYWGIQKLLIDRNPIHLVIARQVLLFSPRQWKFPEVQN